MARNTRFRRTASPSSVRVGRTDPIGEQVDPAKYRDFWRAWYNRASEGQRRYRAALLFTLVENRTRALLGAIDDQIRAGGQLDQVRLDALRILDRIDGWNRTFAEIFSSRPDDVGAEEWDAYVRDVYRVQIHDALFRGYSSLIEDEVSPDGYRAPPGELFAVAALGNQVAAVGEVGAYLNLDPSVPWWRWLFQASAAGWVAILNEASALINAGASQAGVAPGPGWGTGMAESAEAAEVWVETKAQQIADAVKKAGGAAVGIAKAFAVGVGLFLGSQLLGSRRR